MWKYQERSEISLNEVCWWFGCFTLFLVKQKKNNCLILAPGLNGWNCELRCIWNRKVKKKKKKEYLFLSLLCFCVFLQSKLVLLLSSSHGHLTHRHHQDSKHIIIFFLFTKKVTFHRFIHISTHTHTHTHTHTLSHTQSLTNTDLIQS